ncbi:MULTISPECIES: tail fiber assembly protein [Citrobacter]|nr:MULTISPECIES: tail fiber assembly protein [Citrobacter]MDM3434657.1 tail fiber assembly protein [Citrobacter sp. Cb034]WFO45154.1 tail fiber assembly protein [Citrobacter braakii]
MTNYYYSATNNVFVTAGSTLLSEAGFSDAAPVDDVVFDEYFRTIKDGMRRVAGDDGLPAWQKIPPPTPEEIKAAAIAAAEQKKSQLLAEASEVTRGWQTDLLLGTISDEDKAKLIEWRTYIKELEGVDTSSAPKINWSEKPAV